MSVQDWMIEEDASVERARVVELHYITPITNLPSIMKRGILSKVRADPLSPSTVADANVQDIRDGKVVPNGRPLHEYANLYFDARNPMMFKRRSLRHDIVVVRVSPDVLDLPGVVIADGNAASTGTTFYASPQGLQSLAEDRVYATYWTDPDFWMQIDKKRQRCAEVLVPDVIPAAYIRGCYACTEGVRTACETQVPGIVVEVSKHVFFD